MKMSTKARYGLYAAVELTSRGREEVVPVSELAQKIGVSEKYLEQILALLKNADILTSIRGANGGYRLSRLPDSITVGEVLRALEDNLEIVTCLSKKCDNNCNCVSHNLWRKLYDHINDYLDSITLKQLFDDSL